MKNLVMPVMSEEDREKAWSNLKVGDKLLYIGYDNWYGNHVFKFLTVIKKTPKGSIRLDNDTLLKYFPYNYHIITDDLEEYVVKIKTEDNVIKLLREASNCRENIRDNLTYEDVIDLKNLLQKLVNAK